MPILGSSPTAVVPLLPGRPVTAAPDATVGLATPPLPAGFAPYCFILGQVGGAVTSRVFTVPANQPPTQQGDTLLITFNIASNAMTISAVNDSAGNTYVLDSNSPTTSPQQRNYRAVNASPMGPGSTVTVTTSATNANLTMSGLCVPCAAWEGVPDVIGAVTTAATVGSMSQSITPTADGELIIFSNVNQSIGGPNYTDPPFFGQWFNTFVPGTNEVTWSYLACGAGTAGVPQTCNVRFGQANNARMAGWAFKPNQMATGFEAGTSGNVLATGLAASGENAWDYAIQGSGATAQYDSAHAHSGTLSAQIATTSTAQAFAGWTTSLVGVQPQLWARLYVYMTAAPTTNSRLLTFYGTPWTTTTYNGFLRLNTGGKLALCDASSTQRWVSAAALPLNQWCRVEFYVHGDAANGQLEARLWTTHPEAPAASPDDGSGLLTTFGTYGQIGGVAFGVGASGATAGPYWLDDCAVSTGAWVGPTAAASVAQADAAGAVDDTGLAVSAAVSLADIAGAAEALVVSGAVPVADTAGAADVVARPAETIALADAAGAAEALAVTVTLPLPDQAAAVESVSVVAPPTVPTQVATGLTSGAGTSRTATVTQATGAGDTLIALVSTQATACTISALTDSKGNVYTLDRSYAGAVPLFYAFRSPGQTGGPGGGPTAALAVNDTVTATSTAATGNVEIQLIDVPGVGPVDQIGVLTNSVGATQTASATPAQNGEMCLALQVNANSGGTPTVGSPFTLVATYHTGVNVYNTASYQQLSAGTGAGSAQNYSATTAVSSGYSALVYTFTPINKLETLTDSFPGSSVDSTKWNVFNTVSVSGGILTLTSPANSTSGGVITSTSVYDLTGSYFMAQLVAVGTPGTNTQALLKIIKDASNAAQIFVQNNLLACQTQTAGSWSAWLNGAGGGTAYNPAVHRFLRIRESGGTIYFDTSPDCVAWTNLASTANPWPVTAVQASVQCGAYATGDPASSAQFDNVNILTGGYPVLWPETAAAAEAAAIAATVPLIEPDQAAAVEQFQGTPPATILPRCHRSGDSGATTTTAIAPNYASMTNSGMGLAGTVPVVGDLVVLVVHAHLAALTMSQTADTANGNSWQFLNGSQGDNNGGAVGMTSIIAYRYWTGAESSPAWTISSACRVAFSTMCFGPTTAGQNINIDTAVGMVTDQAATAHTPPSSSAALGGELSLVLGTATGGSGGTNPLTYANGAWTVLATRNNTGAGGSGPGSQSFGTFIGVQAGMGPGTINPDAWTIQGSASPTGNTNVNFYHLTVTAAPVPATRLTNSFDTGPNLVNITPANSYPGPLGQDNGFQVVQASGNGSVVYDGTKSAFGRFSAAIVNGSVAGGSYVGWGQQFGATPPLGGPASNKQLWFRFYYFQTAAPGANQRTFQISTQGDPTFDVGQYAIFLRAVSLTNKWAVIDATGTVVYTSTASIPNNTWCRVEGTVIGDPTNGGIQVSFYPTASPTATPETFTALTGQATGGFMGFIEFGGPVSASSLSYSVDEVGVSNTGPLGAIVGPYADRAAAVDSLAVSLAAIQADAAGAADAIAVSAIGVSEADFAAAAESLSVTVTLPLADTAAAAETVALPAKTLPLPDAAAAADTMVLSGLSIALADTAGAADAIAATGQAPALADAAAAAEALALPSKTLTLPDTAGAADTAAVTSIGIALAEVAGGSDVLSVGGTSSPALAEQAAAVEALTATITLPLADTAAAADTSQPTAEVLPVADAAAATEGSVASAAAPLAEQAAGSDALAVTAAVLLPDQAAAIEGSVASAAAPLADAAAAAEAVSTVQGLQVALADSAGAADTLALAAAVPLADAAAAAEVFLPAAAVPLAERGGGVDACTTAAAQSIVVADVAAGSEQLFVAETSLYSDQAAAAEALAVSAAPGYADVAGAADAFTSYVGVQILLNDYAAAAGEESGQILVPEPVSPGAPFGGHYVTTVTYNGHGVLQEGPGFTYNTGPGWPGTPVIPGGTYHFQVVIQPVPGDASSNGTAQIQWLDAGSNSIGTTSNNLPGGLSGWQVIDVWGVAPANARYCYVQFWYSPVDASTLWYIGQATLSAFAGLAATAAVPLPEAGAGLDAEQVTGHEADPDTGHLADAGEGIKVIPAPASQEASTAAEATAIHATLSDPDYGTGTDNDGSVPGRPRDYDTGHFEDSEIKPVSALVEAATADDEAVSIGVRDADTGTATEAAGFTGQVFVFDSDAGGSQEAGAGQGDRQDTDTGHFTDDSAATFPAAGADTASAADAVASLVVFTFWPATLHPLTGQLMAVVWAKGTPAEVTLMTGRLDPQMLTFAAALDEHAARGGTLVQVSDGDSISAAESGQVSATLEARGWLGAGGTQVVGRARAWDGTQWVVPRLLLRGPEGDVDGLEVTGPHPRLGFVLVTAAALPGRWEVIAVAFGLKVAYALVVQHAANPIPLP